MKKTIVVIKQTNNNNTLLNKMFATKKGNKK